MDPSLHLLILKVTQGLLILVYLVIIPSMNLALNLNGPMEVLQVFFSFGQGLGYLGFKSTIFIDP